MSLHTPTDWLSASWETSRAYDRARAAWSRSGRKPEGDLYRLQAALKDARDAMREARDVAYGVTASGDRLP